MFKISYVRPADLHARIQFVISGLIEIAEGMIRVLSMGSLGPSWSFHYSVHIARTAAAKRKKAQQDLPDF